MVVFLWAVAAGTAVQARDAVEIHDAWVRPAYQLPSGTGAYMTLLASRPLRLSGASTEMAAAAELSGTRTKDGVMLMYALPRGIDLPAGKPLVLQPGQYHIILEQLRRPLTAGMTVTLRLQFTDAFGKTHDQDVQAPVRTGPPGQAEASGHGHTHGHH